MALDKSTGNSLFGNIKKEAEKTQTITHEAEPIENIPFVPIASNSTAKWQSFDKVTTLLTEEQKSGLDRMSKKIMKYRSKVLKGRDDKERITANTLIRALVENFLQMEDSIEIETLSSENDVHTWMRKLFKE